MFFIKSGKVAAILPNYNDFRFLKIKQGYFFGELDLLFYSEIRKYTFMATKDSELLVLSKKHFKNIFLIDFRDIGMNFVNNAYIRKQRTRKVFKEAIEFCKENINETSTKKTSASSGGAWDKKTEDKTKNVIKKIKTKQNFDEIEVCLFVCF